MIVRKIRATILGWDVGGGVLTPDLCQVCKKGGPGIVSVRGLNGRYFSAHRWPCAQQEGLVVADPPTRRGR